MVEMADNVFFRIQLELNMPGCLYLLLQRILVMLRCPFHVKSPVKLCQKQVCIPLDTHTPGSQSVLEYQNRRKVSVVCDYGMATCIAFGMHFKTLKTQFPVLH